jgi:hypothetical protein
MDGSGDYGFVSYSVRSSKEPQVVLHTRSALRRMCFSHILLLSCSCCTLFAQVFAASMFRLQPAVMFEQLQNGPFTITANLVQGLVELLIYCCCYLGAQLFAPS